MIRTIRQASCLIEIAYYPNVYSEWIRLNAPYNRQAQSSTPEPTRSHTPLRHKWLIGIEEKCAVHWHEAKEKNCMTKTKLWSIIRICRTRQRFNSSQFMSGEDARWPARSRNEVTVGARPGGFPGNEDSKPAAPAHLDERILRRRFLHDRLAACR